MEKTGRNVATELLKGTFKFILSYQILYTKSIMMAFFRYGMLAVIRGLLSLTKLRTIDFECNIGM